MRSHCGIIGRIERIKHVSTPYGFLERLQIHNFAAITSFDLKIIITGAARFANTIILNLFVIIF